MGEVEGEPPIVEDPDEIFVAVPLANVHPLMGGGVIVDVEPAAGRPYDFQKSWIKNGLRANPADVRIMHMEGESMMPTLNDGDIVLVDIGRRAPSPPGKFVLHDGMGLVAKRLEHIPNSEPPRMKIVSDNDRYAPYEQLAEEMAMMGRIRCVA